MNFSSKMVEFNDDLKTDRITLVEFGAGYSTKTAFIMEKLVDNYKHVEFVPIDVSSSACELNFNKYKHIVEVHPFIGTYDEYISKGITYPNRVIYMWLGSSIGNLTKSERNTFLESFHKCLTFQDILLIGFDTVYKDPSIIKAAYDDHKGVNARFIINCLTHIKERFKVDFNEQSFAYIVQMFVLGQVGTTSQNKEHMNYISIIPHLQPNIKNPTPNQDF